NAAEFGGNARAGGQRGAFTGGQPAGGGARRGRRGRRGGADIDYDYSYVSADAGAKTTTKLGDVYADLFAQFGLTETKGGTSAAEDEATNRKSTRLNSSHVKISYAVFCLKKKKKKKHAKENET